MTGARGNRRGKRTPASYAVAAIGRAARLATAFPPGRGLARAYHRAEFAAGRPEHGYHGRFATEADALADVPPGPVGYDHADMTGFYAPGQPMAPSTIDPSDYAVLFWLDRILPDARRVFDLGGYVGNLFYEYRRFLAYPDALRWEVCDVGAVVDAGEALAASRGERGIAFTTDRLAADGADILLAAGSLQYLGADALPNLLRGLRAAPPHVIVQRTPLHPSFPFVTLQVASPRGRPVFCPYTVAARAPFIGAMEALGYETVDSWIKPRVLDVPTHPACRLDGYTGLYFRRRTGTGAPGGDM